MIKYLLQGRWLGHPLHPAIVHIPIALWVGSLLFDILSVLGVGGNGLVQASFWAIAIGLLSTLLVVPAGIADWSGIKKENPAWKLGLYHMILNLLVALLYAFIIGLRWTDRNTATAVDLLPLLLNIVAVILLAVSGYLGGRMVYDYGTSVARQSKHKWRAVAAAGGSNVPEEK